MRPGQWAVAGVSEVEASRGPPSTAVGKAVRRTLWKSPGSLLGGYARDQSWAFPLISRREGLAIENSTSYPSGAVRDLVLPTAFRHPPDNSLGQDPSFAVWSPLSPVRPEGFLKRKLGLHHTSVPDCIGGSAGGETQGACQLRLENGGHSVRPQLADGCLLFGSGTLFRWERKGVPTALCLQLEDVDTPDEPPKKCCRISYQSTRGSLSCCKE